MTKNIFRILFTVSVFSFMFLLTLGCFLSINTNLVLAADGSIRLNSTTFDLSDDADSNGMANIGDTVTLNVDIDNTDDNPSSCATTTTIVIADLSTFGGSSTQSVSCRSADGGDNLLFRYNQVISDAGISGIDVDAGVARVELDIDDADETNLIESSSALSVVTDTIAPIISVPGTITLTDDAQSDGIASIGDTITYAEGTETTGDIVGWGADLSGYGFSSSAGPDQYVLLEDDDNNIVFAANEIVMDDGGNVAGAPTAVTVVDFTNIDNVAPTINADISIESDNPLDTTRAKAGDKISLTFTSSEPLLTPNVVFYSGGDPVVGPSIPTDLGGGTSWQIDYYVDSSDTDGVVFFTLDYTDLAYNAGAQETGTDDASGVTVDMTPPSISQITFKTQAGAFPNHDSVLWYNYPNDTFEAYVEGNEDLLEIRICTRSLTENTPNQTCSVGDFDVIANYLSSGPVGASSWTFSGADIETLAGGPLTDMAGYSMNLQLIDMIGNVYTSPLPDEALVMVWNVDPKVLDPDLNNLSTTDWATINDFTDVTGLIFRAEDAGELLGELSFPGSIDLTDSETVEALQNFAENVIVGGGDAADGSPDIGVDAGALAAFNEPADLSIGIPGGTSQPGIIVYDDAGEACGLVANDVTDAVVCGDTISDIAWDGLNEVLTFSTDGFSSFGADNTIPVVVTYSPADNATGVLTTANLILTFSKNVTAGTGNVIIKKVSDNSTVQTIDITSGQVTFDGTNGVTINPASNLSNGTEYYVQIDAGAITDSVGNPYAGIADTTTWSFKTKSSGTSGGGSSSSTVVPVYPVAPTETPTSPSISSFTFSKFLKLGTVGNEVQELQKLLNQAPYNSGLALDGKFGPLTKAAVIKFQLANGLVGDGLVGPLTRAVLNK